MNRRASASAYRAAAVPIRFWAALERGRDGSERGRNPFGVVGGGGIVDPG